MDFFDGLDVLVATHPVVIDRPRGSTHPSYPAVVSPLDYGYLDGTVAADGQGVDLFRGDVVDGGLTGAYVIVDLGKSELETKLLVDCTMTEVGPLAGARS